MYMYMYIIISVHLECVVMTQLGLDKSQHSGGTTLNIHCTRTCIFPL